MTSANGHLAAPPHDLAAETYTLAAMMSSPSALAEIVDVCSAEDFYRPSHADVFHAMIVLWAGGSPVDPVSVCDYIGREMSWRPFGGEGPGRMMIAELHGMPVPNGTFHARIIRREAVRRALVETGTRLAQRAAVADADPYAELAAAEVMLAEMARETQQAGITQPMSVAAYLARDWQRLAPVIPGVLDAEDRVIFVGPEGAGKTLLLLQLAFAAAIGVHPFTAQPIPAQRVCWINLENPQAHVVSELGKLRDIAERWGPWAADNLIVWNRRQGVNLKAALDRARLAAVLRARPQLVVAGPVYKMVRDQGEGAEQLHSAITNFWDDQIDRHGFALALETHMPGKTTGARREGRPIGSSLYQRWPEFGFNLVDGKKGELLLSRFRKDRIRGREWPVAISPSTMGGWPWSARYEPGAAALPGWASEDPGQES